MPLRPFPKLRPNGWDALVAAAVVALAVGGAAAARAGVGGETGALTAVVTADGEVAERIPLSEPDRREYTVQSGGYTLVLAAEAGEIWVEHADCPTQDCVRTGHISQSGQSIVCLPGRTVVRLEGAAAEDGGVDAVIG